MEVVGKLIAANAHINLKDEVSTSLHDAKMVPPSSHNPLP